MKGSKASKLISSKDLHYEFSNIFMNSLNKLRLEDNFCDIKVKVVEEGMEYEYTAHSIVIAAHSPVLQDYILQCDQKQKQLSLSDTTKEEVEALLNFMYGIFPHTHDAWKTLIDLAESYEISAASCLYETWKGQQGWSTSHGQVRGHMPKVVFRKGKKRAVSSDMSEDVDEFEDCSESDVSPNSSKKMKVNFEKMTGTHYTPGEGSEAGNLNRFVCGVCNETFENMKVLFQHVKTHSSKTKDGKPKERKKIIRTIYQCGKCSLQYSSPKDLKEHLKTHTGSKENDSASDAMQLMVKQYESIVNTQHDGIIIENQEKADAEGDAGHLEAGDVGNVTGIDVGNIVGDIGHVGELTNGSIDDETVQSKLGGIEDTYVPVNIPDSEDTEEVSVTAPMGTVFEPVGDELMAASDAIHTDLGSDAQTDLDTVDKLLQSTEQITTFIEERPSIVQMAMEEDMPPE